MEASYFCTSGPEDEPDLPKAALLLSKSGKRQEKGPATEWEMAARFWLAEPEDRLQAKGFLSETPRSQGPLGPEELVIGQFSLSGSEECLRILLNQAALLQLFTLSLAGRKRHED